MATPWSRKYFAVVDEGWSTWDLEVQGGLWSRGRVTVATEYHGGERRVLRVKTALRASLVTRIGLTVAILGAFHQPRQTQALLRVI